MTKGSVQERARGNRLRFVERTPKHDRHAGRQVWGPRLVLLACLGGSYVDSSCRQFQPVFLSVQQRIAFITCKRLFIALLLCTLAHTQASLRSRDDIRCSAEILRIECGSRRDLHWLRTAAGRPIQAHGARGESERQSGEERAICQSVRLAGISRSNSSLQPQRQQAGAA